MTDTPIQTTFPPPPFSERLKSFIGDLARPFAIIVTSLSASWAGITIAYRVQNIGLEGAALFMGAIYTGVAALYGAKAWENARAGKQDADVKIAQAAGPAPAP